MIEVSHLTKRYGQHVAVRDLNFSVADGEILGFLGPNGAGKSTTMNMLTGYLSATAGTITVNGHDVLTEPNAVKASIGYLPELPPLYLDMTVKEYLNFMYDLKKCTLPRQKHLAEVCHLVKIDEVADRLIKNLSKGYRQRVGLAQALVGNPPVLILDEPTVGLDPNQIIEIRSLIKSLGKHHTVILSSHILPEVEAVCDRLIIIADGQIVADGTPTELAKAQADDRRLTVAIEGNEAEISALLKGLPGMKSVVALGKKEEGVYAFRLQPLPDADIRRDLFTRLADAGMVLLSSRSNEPSLEELFISLTHGDNSKKKEGEDE